MEDQGNQRQVSEGSSSIEGPSISSKKFTSFYYSDEAILSSQNEGSVPKPSRRYPFSKLGSQGEQQPYEIL